MAHSIECGSNPAVMLDCLWLLHPCKFSIDAISVLHSVMPVLILHRWYRQPGHEHTRHIEEHCLRFLEITYFPPTRPSLIPPNGNSHAIQASLGLTASPGRVLFRERLGGSLAMAVGRRMVLRRVAVRGLEHGLYG